MVTVSRERLITSGGSIKEEAMLLVRRNRDYQIESSQIERTLFEKTYVARWKATIEKGLLRHSMARLSANPRDF